MAVCAVPMVMGEYLYHAGLGVSANLCSHCLRLALVPGPHLLPHSPNAPTRRHRVPATEVKTTHSFSLLCIHIYHYFTLKEALQGKKKKKGLQKGHYKKLDNVYPTET